MPTWEQSQALNEAVGTEKTADTLLQHVCKLAEEKFGSGIHVYLGIKGFNAMTFNRQREPIESGVHSTPEAALADLAEILRRTE